MTISSAFNCVILWLLLSSFNSPALDDGSARPIFLGYGSNTNQQSLAFKHLLILLGYQPSTIISQVRHSAFHMVSPASTIPHHSPGSPRRGCTGQELRLQLALRDGQRAGAPGAKTSTVPNTSMASTETIKPRSPEKNDGSADNGGNIGC